MSDEEDRTGYRDCLTASQTRALLALWSRFFQACTAQALEPIESTASSSAPTIRAGALAAGPSSSASAAQQEHENPAAPPQVEAATEGEKDAQAEQEDAAVEDVPAAAAETPVHPLQQRKEQTGTSTPEPAVLGEAKVSSEQAPTGADGAVASSSSLDEDPGAATRGRNSGGGKSSKSGLLAGAASAARAAREKANRAVGGAKSATGSGASSSRSSAKEAFAAPESPRAAGESSSSSLHANGEAEAGAESAGTTAAPSAGLPRQASAAAAYSGQKLGSLDDERPPQKPQHSGHQRSATMPTRWNEKEQGSKGVVEDLASGKHIPKDDAAKSNLRVIEEAKEMKVFLERYGGAKLREVFWRGLVKGEHPDAVMLRFLRSRKWDVDRALNVIGSTARFRVENDVDELLKGGELEMTRTRGGRNIFSNGLSYVCGSTHSGEPVYIIEVGSHFSSNQTQLELQRGVIYMQEWISLLMPPPVERKVVIFNMSNFGLRNMDWWCVFFMVKTVERFYPESLARVYVHCPPWIFRPIWFVLKPLLDPVVRDKVRLTSTLEELEEMIPWDHLPRGTLKGGLDWAYEWPPAKEGENDIQTDESTAEAKLDAFFATTERFEKATRDYIRLYSRADATASTSRSGRSGGRYSDRRLAALDSPTLASSRKMAHAAFTATNDASSLFVDEEEQEREWGEPDGAQEHRGRRDVIATRLRVNFLELRPYIIGTSKYDRWNVMRSDGTIRWEYPKLDGTREEQVLGENASLATLKTGLELIDEAEEAQAQAKLKARREREAAQRRQLQAHPPTERSDSPGLLQQQQQDAGLAPTAATVQNGDRPKHQARIGSTTSTSTAMANRGTERPVGRSGRKRAALAAAAAAQARPE